MALPANATLLEVAAALRAVAGEESPAESVAAEATNTPAILTVAASGTEDSHTWVRNFVIDYVTEAA